VGPAPRAASKRRIDGVESVVPREAWIAVAVVVVLIGAVTLYGAVKLAKRLFATKRLLSELGGTSGKVAFWGALIYTILPIDLLPDPIYLDDMGVLAIALLYMTNLVRKRRAAMPRIPSDHQRITRR
jgi:4-amino-4-deoxy-L-arabinose transferase-like glycosyltransferase